MICTRCIYDDTIPGIIFDDQGVCSYCHQVDEIAQKYGTGTQKGENMLKAIVSDIKAYGAHRKYNCVVGVSGGTDSSFTLLKAVELGLRPLAVHYDNTWNSSVASENIRKITAALNVDLHTHVIDHKEHDAIKLAYMKSGVQEFDTDTDLAYVQVLRRTAAKYGVRYILEGHSFVAEGISPADANYFDGGYIEDIVKRFGNIRFLTYPHMDFFQFMKWILVYRQKFVRPLWYMDYSKEEAQRLLEEKTGWQNYDGHHLENRATAFAHTVWIPQRFGTDYRILTLAARVRNGKLDREEALSIYRQPVKVDAGLVKYVRKRLGLTESEYNCLMQGEVRTWRDFRTYKKRFEQLRPLFAILAKANRVPMSFYLKYCFPAKDKK